jgi:hypothetical protein
MVYSLTMKFMVLFALTVLAVTIPLAFSQPVHSADTAPHIELSEYSWHLGMHPQDTIVYHDLFIYNTGTSDLTVNNVEAPCGCTVLDMYDYPVVIPPDGEHLVNISFRTMDYRGEVSKMVRVLSDDTTNSTITVNFWCYVIPPDDNHTAVTFTFTVTTTTIPPAATTTTSSPAVTIASVLAVFSVPLLLRMYRDN